jgi:hypothetical protein
MVNEKVGVNAGVNVAKFLDASVGLRSDAGSLDSVADSLREPATALGMTV